MLLNLVNRVLAWRRATRESVFASVVTGFDLDRLILMMLNLDQSKHLRRGPALRGKKDKQKENDYGKVSF